MAPTARPVIGRPFDARDQTAKLPKQKARQKHRITDRLISCWLSYQTGNLKKPEPLVTVHKIFQKKLAACWESTE